MFTYRSQVDYADTDMAGIVHFSRFFCYMEAAEHALLRSLGLAIRIPCGDYYLSWPRVSCSFDFKEPLRFEDEFEVRIGIETIGEKAVTFCADIVRDDRYLASGRSTSACCEVHAEGKLKAVAIPGDIRAKLESAVHRKRGKIRAKD